MSCQCDPPKEVYLSRDEARHVARKALRVGQSGSKMRPYRCPSDDKLWHLTTWVRRRKPPGG